MIAFIIRRLFASIGVLLAVGLVAFVLFRYVGDPVNQMVGIETPESERAALREQLGLNDPALLQCAALLGAPRISTSASPTSSSSRSPI